GVRLAGGLAARSTGVFRDGFGNAAQPFAQPRCLIFEELNQTVGAAIALGAEVLEELCAAGRVFIGVQGCEMCRQNVHIADTAGSFADALERFCEVCLVERRQGMSVRERNDAARASAQFVYVLWREAFWRALERLLQLAKVVLNFGFNERH